MKSIVKFAGVFLSIQLVLFSSCSKNIDLNEEIRVTDSLKKELLETTARFNVLDSIKIKYCSQHINEIFAFVNANLKDTISKEEAALLSDFKNSSKAFKKYERTRKDLLRYYNYNLKQLEDLSFDLRNQNIPSRDSAQKFIRQEINANRELVTMMRLHAEIIPRKLIKCDSLFPLAEKFLMKINNGVAPVFNSTSTSITPSTFEEND